MIKEIQLPHYDPFVKYKDSQENKDMVFNKLIEWYTKHDLFCGESIAQSDDGNIYAHVVLGDIADKLFSYVED